jgi:hypothetical protein
MTALNVYRVVARSDIASSRDILSAVGLPFEDGCHPRGWIFIRENLNPEKWVVSFRGRVNADAVARLVDYCGRLRNWRHRGLFYPFTAAASAPYGGSVSLHPRNRFVFDSAIAAFLAFRMCGHSGSISVDS